MRTRTRVAAITLICPLVLGGCQQTLKDNRDLLITAAAGVGGAFAGSLLGKGSGKLIATGAGALAGVVIGSQIARYLDEQDKKAIEETTQEAISTAADGQALSWSNPDKAVHAEVVPSNTREEVRQVKVRRAGNVAPTRDLRLIGETYAARTSSRVRSGPGTGHAMVGGLRAGETFTAVGSVKGEPWVAVGREGVTVGYVHARLVGPASEVERMLAEQAEVRTASAETAAAQSEPSVSSDLKGAPAGERLAEGDAAPEMDVVDLDAMIEEEVEVSTTCRDVDVTVEAGEAVDTQSLNACRNADGVWEIG